MDTTTSSSDLSTITETSSITEFLRLRAGARKRKAKRKKEPEVTSLDRWIQEQKAIHENDPELSRTEEEIIQDREKRIQFVRMSAKDKKIFLASKEQEMREQMTRLYFQFNQEQIVKKCNELKAIEEREDAEFLEVPVRYAQLEDTREVIIRLIDARLEFLREQTDNFDWEFSFIGGSLPYPLKIQNVNAYLTQWMDVNTKLWTMEEAVARIKDVMYFIRVIKDHIGQARNLSRNELQEWRRIVNELKIMLQRNLNYGTNHILEDVLEKMETNDYKIAHFKQSNEYFTLTLRAKLMTPIPRPNPQTPPEPPVVIEFDSPKCKFFIPESMDITNVAIRILILNYDHFSSQCVTYADPYCPEEYRHIFKDFVKLEWEEKQKIKYERRRRKGYKKPNAKDLLAEEEKKHTLRLAMLVKKGKKKGKKKAAKPEIKIEVKHKIIGEEEEEEEEMEPELTIDEIISKQWLYDREITPIPSEIMDNISKNISKGVLQEMLVPDENNVISLRKYLIVGGVKYINFLKIPVQPNRLMMEASVRAQQIPKKLIELPYNIVLPDKQKLYTESFHSKKSGTSAGILDESSKFILEMSESFLSRDDVDKLRERLSKTSKKSQLETTNQEDSNDKREETEEERIQRQRQYYLDQMVSITIEIPRDIYWIDDPVLCRWDDQQRRWTTRAIHECTIDRDQWTISFRAGRFGVFAFAISRQNYLPFVWWNLKPDNETIVFTLTTKILTFVINVRLHKYIVTEILDNQGNRLPQAEDWGILKREFNLNELIEVFRFRGIDIFPCFETFNYIQNVSEKFWIFERYVYYCISFAVFSYEFQPSKWNFTAGLRKIFFQVREISFKKFRIIYNDIWRSSLLRATEEEIGLDLTPEKGIPFSADFYQLYKNSANVISKKYNKDKPSETRFAVFELLTAFRPFSFTYFIDEERMPPEDNRCFVCKNNERFIKV